MPVPKHHTTVSYRQHAATIKIYTEGKPSERRVSERPRKHMDQSPGPANPFTDSDEEPTLVRFRETDDVDVDQLLASGAISVRPPQPRADPKPPAETKGGDSPG